MAVILQRGVRDLVTITLLIQNNVYLETTQVGVIPPTPANGGTVTVRARQGTCPEFLFFTTVKGAYS